jgi:ribosomal-protein-alanine N-acetyltransferase
VSECRQLGLVGAPLISDSDRAPLPGVSLETPRLLLLPCSPEHLLVLIDQPQRLEQLLGVPGAERLREFYISDDVSPDWLAALRKAREPDPWRHGFFVVDRATRSVIGSAGFKGPPDVAGMVEIAYGIVPGFEGQGFATEAAAALVGFAFASGDVRLVRAHTLPAANPSTRVLLKCGFHHVGTVVDPDDGPVWRWERGP